METNMTNPAQAVQINIRQWKNLTCDDAEGCIIEVLLKNPFSRFSHLEKTEIKKVDRPMPDLSSKLTCEIKVKQKTSVRHFQKSYYDNHKWLCACVTMNKMFCWPCLLFSNDKTVWRTTGYNNLNNFFNAAAKHEKSQTHIFSNVAFKMFDRSTRIDVALDEQRKLNILEQQKSSK